MLVLGFFPSKQYYVISIYNVVGTRNRMTIQFFIYEFSKNDSKNLEKQKHIMLHQECNCAITQACLQIDIEQPINATMIKKDCSTYQTLWQKAVQS